jgi:hypothetical protein
MSVELRLSAAEATNPPAPRVDDGIIQGIFGFVGDSFGFGNDSVRRNVSSFESDTKDGEDLDAANRETEEYGDVPARGSVDSEGMSCCEIIVRKVLSLACN